MATDAFSKTLRKEERQREKGMNDKRNKATIKCAFKGGTDKLKSYFQQRRSSLGLNELALITRIYTSCTGKKVAGLI
jgi:hypothetical protein